MLTLTLRDFRRAGVDQDESVRARIRELAERETEVAQEFSKNIRDGVRTISRTPPSPTGCRRTTSRRTSRARTGGS